MTTSDKPAVIVPGGYKYSGFDVRPRPPEKPEKCGIVTCGSVGLYYWRHWLYDLGAKHCRVCEKHNKAMYDRVHRMGERVSVPDEPTGPPTSAARGIVVYGVRYNGTCSDDPEDLSGPFFASEADAALCARRLNLLSTSRNYSVEPLVIR